MSVLRIKEIFISLFMMKILTSSMYIPELSISRNTTMSVKLDLYFTLGVTKPGWQSPPLSVNAGNPLLFAAVGPMLLPLPHCLLLPLLPPLPHLPTLLQFLFWVSAVPFP